MTFFSFLTTDEIRYVHDASLEILEESGLLVRNEKARERFARHALTSGAQKLGFLRVFDHPEHGDRTTVLYHGPG